MGKMLSGNRVKKTWLGLFVLLLLLIIWGGYYWWSSSHPKTQYVTADATQGDIERSVSVTGSINPRNTVQVGSYVSGTVKSLFCDFNTQVKAGQICAKIDPSTFQVVVDQNAAQLNSTRAQLHKDEAALVYTKAVFDRDTSLLKDGIVAQEIFDNDRNLFKQAAAQIDLDKAAIVAQEASLKSAMVNLGYTNIVSPVTGTVLTRNVDVGQTVASSLQTPTLFLIGKDLTKMQVDANVSEADVGRIKVDQEVSFTVQAYPDKTFKGKVKQIRRGPITVQNVVTYDVVVEVDNPELLLFPGMTADAEIVTDSHENVLCIPLAATRYTPERKGHGKDSARGQSSGHNEESEKDNSAGDDNRTARHEPAASASANAVASDSQPADKQAHGQHGDHHGGDHWHHHGEHQGQQEANNSGAPDAGRHHGEHHRHAEDQASAASSVKDASESAGANIKSDNKQDDKHATKADDDDDDSSPASASTSTSVSTSASAAANISAVTAKPEPQPFKKIRIWVMRDGVPTPVRITIGLDDGDLVEVIGGDLKPSDKVIVSEVRPVEAKSAPIQSPFNQGGGGGRRGGGGLGRP